MRKGRYTRQDNIFHQLNKLQPKFLTKKTYFFQNERIFYYEKRYFQPRNPCFPQGSGTQELRKGMSGQ